MSYAKKLNVLYKEIKCFVRRDLIRYFIIVFKRECDARVERKVGFQISSTCYHISHIFFYYIKNCFRKALKE